MVAEEAAAPAAAAAPAKKAAPKKKKKKAPALPLPQDMEENIIPGITKVPSSPDRFRTLPLMLESAKARVRLASPC